MLTDLGLCYSLNGETIGNLFQGSEYMDALSKHMTDSDWHGNASASEAMGGPMKTRGSGTRNIFRIVLDSERLDFLPL